MYIKALFLIIFSFSLYSSDYYYNFGKKIKIKESENFIGIKTKYDFTIDGIKKKLESCKNISKILEVKHLGKDIFLLKFSESQDKNFIKKLTFVKYLIKGYYFKNKNVWPLFADKQIVLKFKKNIPQSRIEEIIKENHLVLKDKIKLDEDFLILRTENNKKDVLDLADELFTEYKEIEYSYPDFINVYKKTSYLNDTYLPNQWHHKNGTGGVDSFDAWDISLGSKSIKIAVIDDGIDSHHEDLNVVASKNFSTENENDGAEHGTACAGVAAAKGDNGKGMAGICPNCSLISAKLLSENGAVYATSASQAFRWSALKGADVLSNSWGSQEPTPVSEDLKYAINYVAANGRNGKGVVILFAVGNDARELYSYEVSSLDEVIAVGASDYQDKRAVYSNFGNYLDVVAPSSAGTYQSFHIPEGNIWTTDRSGREGYNNNGINSEYYVSEVDEAGNYTKYFGGTSSATPLVAGLAGLILSKAPNLRFSQVMDIIKNTTDKIGGTGEYDENGYSRNFGYGKVNAFKALKRAEELSDCTPERNGEICDDNKDNDCDGFIDMNDADCNDLDPCVEYTCGENEICVFNESFNPQSFKAIDIICECKEGFVKEGNKCIRDPEYNPCQNINCSNHGVCEVVDMEQGIVKCVCDEGFHNEGDNGLRCRLDDICTGVTCEENAFCLKDDGKCHCKRGYYDENGACLKYDEGSLCESAMCFENAKCSYDDGECYCNEGYQYNEDNKCVKVENNNNNSDKIVKNNKNSSGCSYSQNGSFSLYLIFFVFIYLFGLKFIIKH